LKEKHIYLCGKMGGLSYEEYTGWRNEIDKGLKERADGIDLTIISPPEFFNFEKKMHDNELEVMQWELNEVRKCDVIIANLNFSNSTGSNIEMYEAWKNDIPIIALWDKDEHYQHPWVETMVTRVFTTQDELADYVDYYYLF
jgi:nucleoside 2-deoxyribosyltransferase